ncbi:hypothetical protein [Crossiella cryophila]|uniref:Putative small secreted protein n=1 Tax=Crossiella cryophila TaxID=43355 RepID=A0A7W7CD21_9PSEU|nr:hypothetical protein [Crossiella cryophila]MBB4678898.1 putative small secreted protein [Crossiella cryophila]
MSTPTPPITEHPGHSRRLLALVVALCALTITGCATLTELMELGQRIEKAGVQQVSTHQSTESSGLVRLRVQAQQRDPRADAEQTAQGVAKVVWDTYPRRIDELEITLDGRLVSRVNRAELIDRLGERNPALEEDTGDGGLGYWVLFTLIAVAVLLTLGLIALLWWSRRRRGRRAAEVSQIPPPYPPAVAWPPYQGPPPPSGRGRTH